MVNGHSSSRAGGDTVTGQALWMAAGRSSQAEGPSLETSLADSTGKYILYPNALNSAQLSQVLLRASFEGTVLP